MRGDQVSAARYLRMSTENQRYSLMNQAAAIADFAERKGFKIVKSYDDAGRSGLTLRERPALRALLKDVMTRQLPYKAILVYDVSRWGRFQDTDEAATYEFLCRTAGVPVHYCAEQFSNDLSVASSIMKALKRTMAAEYSRELGVKSYEGQKRLVQLGFKGGGIAGYGLRRMLVSAKGKHIRILRTGEHKHIADERTILVPGPKNELNTVRLMYTLLLDGMRPASIARELNRRSIKYMGSSPWNFYAVIGILRHPKYAGWNVWGRTSQKLHEKCHRVPKGNWITSPNAFTPIVDPETYRRAQKILGETTINKSDTDLLNDLKRLLRKRKRLSQQIIDKSRQVASVNTYCHRFGSLEEVYRLVGYHQWEEYFKRRQKAVRTERFRRELIERIASVFPGTVSVRGAPPKRRFSLLVDKNIEISVYLCRFGKWPNGRPCWYFYPVAGETQNVTLLCTMNASNDDVENFYVFRSLGRTGTYRFGSGSKWLKTARRLGSISEFHDAVTVVARLPYPTSQNDRPAHQF